MHTNDHIILGTLASGEPVPLTQTDRRRHVYIVGQTGTGKTNLVLNMMHADLMAGRGFAFLDPHGDASKVIASLTPASRMAEVIYLDPSDPTHSFAYNPLSNVPETERATTAANVVSALKNIWADSWGPRLEYVLSNALRLLLDTRDQTLLGIPLLFADDRYRTWLAKRCRDPLIRFYWQREFAVLDARLRSETISPIQNKVGILLSNPFIRSILCQNASTLDIASVMNRGRVLIVNLSKGNLGTGPAHLLGALLITAFSQAAEARRHIPEEDRRDFTLYVDEFQNFATDSFATILSEARKWRLSLVAVNQHVTQLPEALRHAVFGNAGTLIAFRVGAQDALHLVEELGLPSPRTLSETDNFKAQLRLMWKGTPTASRLIQAPPPLPQGPRFASVASLSRARHAVLRGLAEARVNTLIRRISAPSIKWRSQRRHPDSH